MIGSDISIVLDQKNFGLSEESDPRFVANDVFITKNKINLSKGVFTVCKLKKNKCPPWSLKAKKISHDKLKKTIYYDSATLKIYDIPIFYFPKFFHPDPTVKRQSGFLVPGLMNSKSLGTGLNLPYYFAIAEHKDATINPIIYVDENPVIQTEYRHVTKNTNSTLDVSFNQGYKKTSDKKTGGSRNHIFARSNINLDFDGLDESKLEINIQRVSNDTYLKVHNINSKIMEIGRASCRERV